MIDMVIFCRRFLVVFFMVSMFFSVSEAREKKKPSKVQAPPTAPAVPEQKFELTEEHEKFDFTTIKPKSSSYPAYRADYSRDGTGVVYDISVNRGNLDLWNTIKIIPKNSYFSLTKVFYPDGSLREKGFEGLGNVRFKKGTWYTYDKSGKLIKTRDFDKPFAFTYDDVLKYCMENHIPLPDKQNSRRNAHKTYGEFGTRIDRAEKNTLDDKKIGPSWEICQTTLPRSTSGPASSPSTITYVLDGATGSLLSPKEEIPGQKR